METFIRVFLKINSSIEYLFTSVCELCPHWRRRGCKQTCAAQGKSQCARPGSSSCESWTKSFLKISVKNIKLKRHHINIQTLPAEFFWLPIVEAKAAVLHFLPIHVDGNEEGYKVEQDGARDHLEIVTR